MKQFLTFDPWGQGSYQGRGIDERINTGVGQNKGTTIVADMA